MFFSLSPLSYVFFLSFVFLIVVVLMNLLNGLAVSDTGVIRQEAEIHAYKSQVGIVSYMESMMLGDPFNFLSNWPKFIWLKHIPTCSLVSLMKQIYCRGISVKIVKVYSLLCCKTCSNLFVQNTLFDPIG